MSGRFKGMIFVGVTAFVTLIPFFAIRGTGRVFGENERYAFFFTRGTKPGAFPIANRQERKRCGNGIGGDPQAPKGPKMLTMT